MWEILIFFVAIILLAGFYYSRDEADHESAIWGALNDKILCPHCQSQGFVHTKGIKQKKGVSGGKATAAILTGGVSLLATGLSRKENRLQAHCSNCDVTWDI